MPRMGIFKRPNSQNWWAEFEDTAYPHSPHARLRNIRVSLKIPVEGATPQSTRELRRLAQNLYLVLRGDLARVKTGVRLGDSTNSEPSRARGRDLQLETGSGTAPIPMEIERLLHRLPSWFRPRVSRWVEYELGARRNRNVT